MADGESTGEIQCLVESDVVAQLASPPGALSEALQMDDQRGGRQADGHLLARAHKLCTGGAAIAIGLVQRLRHGEAGQRLREGGEHVLVAAARPRARHQLHRYAREGLILVAVEAAGGAMQPGQGGRGGRTVSALRGTRNTRTTSLTPRSSQHTLPNTSYALVAEVATKDGMHGCRLIAAGRVALEHTRVHTSIARQQCSSSRPRNSCASSWRPTQLSRVQVDECCEMQWRVGV